MPESDMTQKFPVRISDGWSLEILGLTGLRMRLIVTDGINIKDFW